MECELYIKDENGRNTGCMFQNVRIEPEKAYFLVNGSSKDALIPFYDEYIQLYKIGKWTFLFYKIKKQGIFLKEKRRIKQSL